MASFSASSSTSHDFAIFSSSIPAPLPSLNHHIHVKLARDNYLIWRTQLVPYLEGQQLYGYVTGENPCPPEFISSTIAVTDTVPSTSILVPNPEYTVWFHQDKFILSALISTLTEGILSHIVGLKTSRDVWVTLEKMFASQSKA
jgi:hypothetical protein